MWAARWVETTRKKELARRLPLISGRVLKPGGSLLFLEHGEEPSERIQRWQRRVEPTWKKIFGGCHITRQIPRLIEEAGFEIRELESGQLAFMGGYVVPPLKIATFEYWGRAN